eukprot:6184525-Pleurochrysis_carterae.AAC.2
MLAHLKPVCHVLVTNRRAKSTSRFATQRTRAGASVCLLAQLLSSQTVTSTTSAYASTADLHTARYGAAP